MWVKICANTNAEDALLAAELGADALGFVFAPSKRQVNAEQVREIVRELPRGVERVGVFAADGAEAIAAAAEVAELTAVQLHGAFNQRLWERLTVLLGPEVSLMPTVHWNVVETEDSDREAGEQFAEIAGQGSGARVLVDAKLAGNSGGLGVSFDWHGAKGELDRQRSAGLRIVLAGGLRPENVREAIRVLRPWGVDVASGVESSPGTKDPEKLKAFIENARRA